MEWIEYIVAILAGLTTAIPLVVKLVEYVKKCAEEKNWTKLLELVIRLMQEAESKFDNGEERKDWVLMMVRASADTIDYPIDLNVVGDMIDGLCGMSKVVNAKVSSKPAKAS